MEFLRSLLRRRFAKVQVTTSRNVGCFLRLKGKGMWFGSWGGALPDDLKNGEHAQNKKNAGNSRTSCCIILGKEKGIIGTYF